MRRESVSELRDVRDASVLSQFVPASHYAILLTWQISPYSPRVKAVIHVDRLGAHHSPAMDPNTPLTANSQFIQAGIYLIQLLTQYSAHYNWKTTMTTSTRMPSQDTRPSLQRWTRAKHAHQNNLLLLHYHHSSRET